MHRIKTIFWYIKRGYFFLLGWLLIKLGIRKNKVSCFTESILFELKLLLFVFLSTISGYTFIIATAEPVTDTFDIILKINGLFFIIIIFLMMKILYKLKNKQCNLHNPHHSGNEDERK